MMRLNYFKRMRIQNEQEQGTVGEEADGKREEEPGRSENVVPEVGIDGPEYCGINAGVKESVQEVQEAAPKVAPKRKRGRPKKRG